MKMLKIIMPAAALLVGAAWAGAAESPKPVPLTPDEIKTELAKETPEQKKLRGELAELTKTGQKIYFNANCDGTHRIYSMNPDGSNVTCLTPAPLPGGEHPNASLDGTRITFGGPAPMNLILDLVPRTDREHMISDKTQVVYVMPLTGGNPEPVAVGGSPRFSPDGKKVVYLYSMPRRHKRVAIYDLENKKEHPIIWRGLPNPGCYPVISPDGKYLYVCGRGGALLELNAEGTGPAEGAKPLTQPFKIGCNVEWSRDMKWLTWVVDTHGDAGGCLKYAPFDPHKKVSVTRMDLGWEKNTINYFPDFSPDEKYYIYAHADPVGGTNSWQLQSRQELYITRFPKCETTVRVTWNGAANMHPQWWAPAQTAVSEK